MRTWPCNAGRRARRSGARPRFFQWLLTSSPREQADFPTHHDDLLLPPRAPDARALQRLAAGPCGGIGPHALEWMADGRLAVSMQNEGRSARPLFAHLRGRHLAYGEADADLRARCGDYAGDIVAVGELFAVSCTTAGVTALRDEHGHARAILETPRVCATTVRGRRRLVTGDGGDAWEIDPGVDAAGGVQIRHGEFPLARDNHASLPI